MLFAFSPYFFFQCELHSFSLFVDNGFDAMCIYYIEFESHDFSKVPYVAGASLFL